MKKIAFLGLGHMGRPMAQNLIQKKFNVFLFDVQPQAVAETAKAGGKAMSSIIEAIKEAEAVVTMLPASQHVEDLYLGKGNLLKLAKPGTLFIDSSTIAPQSAVKVSSEAKRLGFEMCDAPVSGGTAGAAAGTLTFMVGGEQNTLTKARPILEAMGKNIFHAGDAGMGQVAKICNNMLLAIHMIGTAEALNLGTSLGMNASVLSEIMSKSSGANWSLEKYNPWPQVQESSPASRGYTGGFATDLMMKDLGLALEAAGTQKTSLPLGGLATQLYRMHSQLGSGKLDFSSILNLLKNSGKQV